MVEINRTDLGYMGIYPTKLNPTGIEKLTLREELAFRLLENCMSDRDFSWPDQSHIELALESADEFLKVVRVKRDEVNK